MIRWVTKMLSSNRNKLFYGKIYNVECFSNERIEDTVIMWDIMQNWGLSVWITPKYNSRCFQSGSQQLKSLIQSVNNSLQILVFLPQLIMSFSDKLVINDHLGRGSPYLKGNKIFWRTFLPQSFTYQTQHLCQVWAKWVIWAVSPPAWFCVVFS